MSGKIVINTQANSRSDRLFDTGLAQEGTSEIADAPLQGCDFNELVR